MDAGVLVPIVVLLALLALYLWSSYRSLVALRQRVDEGWADIRAQVEQRAELLPVLVQTVQRHAPHERAALESVTAARAETLQAEAPDRATAAETHLQQALRNVFTAADAYPKLISGPQFLQHQSDLVELQDGIQASRRFYNGGVREFNTRITTFPSSLYARRGGFAPREFFEVGDGPAIAQPPRIQF